ncbi:hypothetical protein [Microcella humidisoli]|uniref:Uncharacterized protein n=1 Tax=Microcella humidisoli TaxID=2963406 RepID=A0ABY5FXH1_9MICO|nr:hypothetical protein [Microcella humidisoli]UTT63001.1 hypothetical protein NNL39_02520 [Microcella humidisoli]
MASFVRRISAPFRGYINRRFAAVHDHLARVESLVEAQSAARLERELAEVREVNQALLDSVQVLGESVARLRDEVRSAAQASPTPADLGSSADGR